MYPKSPQLHPWARYLPALLAGLITALLLWFATYVAAAQSAAPRLDQTQTTLTNVRLLLDDRLLLDQEGVHMSQPATSPDGRWLAVTVVPLGTETADLAQTYIYARATGALQGQLAGHNPQWQTDGQLQLWTNKQTVHYRVSKTKIQLIAEEARVAVAADNVDPLAFAAGPFAYPTSIRVAHHPSNGCRTVPNWQVDVIPFEEYVARVVPAESPASWPVAALAAQAVAARTYAWRQILAGRADYDVTDWANFQMMCDARYPNSDSAVTLTAGQFLSSQADSAGLPISAMYSAENGHPTFTNPNVSYLQAVPDLFALGRTRNGHGYGLSQWGAYRRAVAGHSYRQILGHYYSNVYLQIDGDPGAAGGAFIRVDLPPRLAVDALHLQTLLPANLTPRLRVTTNSELVAPVEIDAPHAIWRAAQGLVDGDTVTAQLWFGTALQDQVTWTVDYSVPAALNVPVGATLREVAPTFQVATSSDTTPLLRSGWLWAGETLSHTTNSGMLINDAGATDGTAWQAQVTQHNSGVWYGPRTTALPPGYNYRALFWLRAGVDATTPPPLAPIARLDVTDDEGRVSLGLRDLWASDFATAGVYQPIAVDFHLFDAPVGVELRVAWPDLMDLALDRVEVWRLPDSAQSTTNGATTATFQWSLRGQVGPRTFLAAQMDRGGNLSAVNQQQVEVVDPLPPYFRPPTTAATWLSAAPLTRTAVVSDSFSGLDFTSGRAVITGEGISLTLPVTISAHGAPWDVQALTATIPTLVDGSYALTFFARDLGGNQAAIEQPLLIDSVAPTATIAASGPLTASWYTAPVTLTIAAQDEHSGVEMITYQIDDGAEQRYRQPVTVNNGGTHTIAAWATDLAGNRSTPATQTVLLDLAAPVVTLRQTPLTPELVRVSWQAADDGSGVAAVELALQRDAGAWIPLPLADPPALAAALPSLISDTIDIDVTQEVETRVRLRARDQVGRLGMWNELVLWVATDWVYLPVISR